MSPEAKLRELMLLDRQAHDQVELARRSGEAEPTRKRAYRPRTHCRYGHELTQGNLTAEGGCLECRHRHYKNYDTKRKGAR